MPKFAVSGTLGLQRFISTLDVEHDRIVGYGPILTDAVIHSQRSFRKFRELHETPQVGWKIVFATPDQRLRAARAAKAERDVARAAEAT